MRAMSTSETDNLLNPLGLKIGNWKELVNASDRTFGHRAFRPVRDALGMYAVSTHLLQWIGQQGWKILQIDNSTAPTRDEINVFEKLAFSPREHWSVSEQRSFLFGDESTDLLAQGQTTLTLIIYFSLVFEWHVHLVSERSATRRHVGIQDGTIYFYGDTKALEEAHTLVSSLEQNPLHISD